MHGRQQPRSCTALGRLQQGSAPCAALHCMSACAAQRAYAARHGLSCRLSRARHALLCAACLHGVDARWARRACAAARAAAPAPAERGAARPSARRRGGRARWASTCAAASARCGRTAPSAAPSATWARSRSSSWARLRWTCSQARLPCLFRGERAWASAWQPGRGGRVHVCGKVLPAGRAGAGKPGADAPGDWPVRRGAAPGSPPDRRAPGAAARAPSKRRGAGSLAGGADAGAGGPPDAPARAWLAPTALGSVVELQCLDARWTAALAAVAEAAAWYPPTRPLAGQCQPVDQSQNSAPRPACARSPI